MKKETSIKEETMDKNIHINSIRRNLGITLKAVSEYENKNSREIETIDTIFDLAGTNKEKVLALLYLFSSGENDNVIQSYRNEAGLQKDLYNSTCGHIKQYNTMLVTALIYNPAFYAMAVNYYGAVNTRYAVGFKRGGFIRRRFRRKGPLFGLSVAAAVFLFAILIPIGTSFFAQKSSEKNQELAFLNNKEILPIGENTASLPYRSPNEVQNIFVIPVGTTLIEDGTYKDWELPGVAIPDSVTSIGEHAFANNRIKDVIIPNSVTSIGWGAFRDNQLSSVTISNSITTIERRTFGHNPLSSVDIPPKVISIKSEAFDGTLLTSVTIGGDVAIDSDAIPGNFAEAYKSNNKAAGTYIRSDTSGDGWTKQ